MPFVATEVGAAASKVHQEKGDKVGDCNKEKQDQTP